MPVKKNLATYGKKGFSTNNNGKGAFYSENRKIGEEKTVIYKYQNHAIRNYGKPNEIPFLDEKILGEYSSKFKTILQNIKTGKGLILISSRFLWGGVLPLALMLEQNGFRRYTTRGETQLLGYDGPKQNKKRCYLCGSHDILSKEHTDPSHKDYHVFKVARYIIVSAQNHLNLECHFMKH